MSSTLSEGVRVPDIGSTSWGADVNYNWGLLNTALANITGNVKTDVANTWTATQTFTETISGSIDGIAARAVGDEDGNNIKAALAGKQPSLSQSQLDACNSGITAAGVQQIGTNADAIATKAADSEVVHLAGAETVTGDKTFTGAVVTHNITPETDGTYTLGTNTYRWLGVYSACNYFVNRPNLTFGTPPSNSDYFGYRYNDNTGAVFGDLLFCAHKDGQNFLRMRCRNTDGTNTYDREIRLHVNRNGTTWLIPNNSDVTELGTSNNKWKTLNGINPGALSFPSAKSARIAVDTTNWDKTNYTLNSYSAPANGWMAVVGTAEAIQVENNTGGYGSTFTKGADGYCESFLPIGAGNTFHCRIKNGGSNVVAYFYPCLGNV